MRSIVVDSDSPNCQIDVCNSAGQHASAFQARPQGTEMCVGSKPLVATSTSIGVNSHELVSLIRVKETDGSSRNCFSRCSAVVTPAKPPPRITTWVVFFGWEGTRGGDSGPRKYLATLRVA